MQFLRRNCWAIALIFAAQGKADLGVAPAALCAFALTPRIELHRTTRITIKSLLSR